MDILFLATKAGVPWIFSFVEQIKTLQAVIFVFGLILLVVEMFIPGFGVIGGTGVALLILGIFLTATTPFEAMVMFAILILIVTVGLLIIFRSAKKGQIAKRLILHQQESPEKGYKTSKDQSHLVGKTGLAITQLRPAGTGEFDGVRLDVVTEGNFIEKNSKIKIIQVHGRRIVVELFSET